MRATFFPFHQWETMIFFPPLEATACTLISSKRSHRLPLPPIKGLFLLCHLNAIACLFTTQRACAANFSRCDYDKEGNIRYQPETPLAFYTNQRPPPSLSTNQWHRWLFPFKQRPKLTLSIVLSLVWLLKCVLRELWLYFSLQENFSVRSTSILKWTKLFRW